MAASTNTSTVVEGTNGIIRTDGATVNTYTAATTTSSAAKALNTARTEITVQNTDSSVAIYIGFEATNLTTSTGLKVAAGGSWTSTTYLGPVFIISASSTVDCRVLEVAGPSVS